jgi:putative SOS response-associated peptidase YedK
LALLLPNYSIGSKFKEIEETLSYEFSYSFVPAYVTRKNQLLPVILDHSEGKIEQARWGTGNALKQSTVYPWVRAEGIIKKTQTRILIRNNRCLIPANGFFINKKNEGTYFIYFPKNKIVTFGGIWRSLKENEMGKPVIVFSLISCASFGKISALTNRIPVVIHPGARRKFLKKDIPLMDITGILRKENNLDFNGIPIIKKP